MKGEYQMELYEKGEHENLIHLLQQHHLEMNEYKKHCDGVPVEYYINLLDTFIEWTKTDRDSIKMRDEMIERYGEMIDKYQGMALGNLKNFIKSIDL